MDLRTLLKNKVNKLKEANSIPTKDEQLKTEEYYFEKYSKEFGVKRNNEEELKIPRFFKNPPGENEPLRQQFREDCASHLLKRRSQLLLDDSELRELWVLLDRNQSFPEDQLMTYSDFKKVASMSSPKAQPYFTSTIFAKLQQGDPQGRIFTMSLFNYVMRKVWLEQTRIGLCLYDSTGQGYLSEMDLENYISDLLPTVPQLEGAIQDQMKVHGAEPVSFQDVKDELFDMVRPKNPERITLEDLLASGHGETFMSILIEFHGFWAYENREAVTADPPQE